MSGKKYAAVVLSAGKGSRMNSATPKQYMLLEGKPVLSYALAAFQESMVEEVVLVAGENERAYCQKEIVSKYGFDKVCAVVAGGRERYHSVFCGLEVLKNQKTPPDYVMIHDGARPFIDNDIILRCAAGAKAHGACVAGMPVKDTIKIAEASLFAKETPDRREVWSIQTPQAFEFPLIYQAYEELMSMERRGEQVIVTDDAMVLEKICGHKVKLIEGSYQNIKITTPEDLEIAEIFCKKR